MQNVQKFLINRDLMQIFHAYNYLIQYITVSWSEVHNLITIAGRTTPYKCSNGRLQLTSFFYELAFQTLQFNYTC